MTLEKIDDRLFRGKNYRTPWRRVFGGQVLGQSLHAAYQTVKEEQIAHSMHGYFILAGDIDVPIIYEVEELRDGRSFTTRRVTAIQKGRAIFNMSCSFQLKQDGYEHQDLAPNVLPPDVLLSDIEQMRPYQESNPQLFMRVAAMHTGAIEFRPVERPIVDGHNSRPSRHVWMKATDDVELSLPMQHQLLAYASDYHLLHTATLPHQSQMQTEPVFFASLDHAIWFHRDFKIDDWLLYATDSPSAGNSRAFTRGSIFDQQGHLVASVAQEGLMRKIDPNYNAK